MKRFLLLTTISLVVTQAALAHIRIYPNESSVGAREKYTMRVPNEKKEANAIRVEGEFPAGLDVYDFEFKPGWKIDFKKDDKGKIIGRHGQARSSPMNLSNSGCSASTRNKAQI